LRQILQDFNHVARIARNQFVAREVEARGGRRDNQ
jgi:glycerol-3-phosphate O-acyltransferase